MNGAKKLSRITNMNWMIIRINHTRAAIEQPLLTRKIIHSDGLYYSIQGTGNLYSAAGTI